VVSQLLRDPFFRKRPPKTAGREQFGREYVDKVLKLCKKSRPEDIVATATALTAYSIAEAVSKVRRMHAREDTSRAFRDYVISGGGANNPTLVAMVTEELAPTRLRVIRTDELGIKSEAKEAVAFAVLAYQTWRGQPSNVPSATGADRPAILGKISYV